MADSVCIDRLGRKDEAWSLVPAGPFSMGSKDGDSDERPVREVTLDAYCIAKYEIANRLWSQYESATGVRAKESSPKGFDVPNQPRVNINRSEARGFCQWLGGDLPTEAQWEKAAKGGIKNLKYPTATGGISKDLANYNFFFGKIKPVGSHPEGPFGTFDMAGNVWEWVLDAYNHSAYTYLPAENPVNSKDTGLGVFRGGGWSDVNDGLNLRAANRVNYDPAVRVNFVGARCALPAVAPGLLK
ncbi:MAG: SUMF1/EgtB/PvdO family nonheme iron enzyme [Deltaproteobacteria bacterium]|nr:SUMF1/EgtB/PvdO family nonheme iron enzyme [Deltaproteobacteria bacterium]